MFNIQPSIIYLVSLVLLFVVSNYTRNIWISGILYTLAALISYFFNTYELNILHLFSHDYFTLTQLLLVPILWVICLYSKNELGSREKILSIFGLNILALFIISADSFAHILIGLEVVFLIITVLLGANYLKTNFLGVSTTLIFYVGILNSYGGLDLSFSSITNLPIFTVSFIGLIAVMALRVCQFLSIALDKEDIATISIYSIIMLSIFPTIVLTFVKYGLLIDSSLFEWVTMSLALAIAGYFVVSVLASVKRNNFNGLANIVVYLYMITLFIVLSLGIYDFDNTGLRRYIIVALLFVIISSMLAPYSPKDLFNKSYLNALVFVLTTIGLFIAIHVGIANQEVGNQMLSKGMIYVLVWAGSLGLFFVRMVKSFRDLRIGVKGETIAFNWLKFVVKLSLILAFSFIIWNAGLMNLYAS